MKIFFLSQVIQNRSLFSFPGNATRTISPEFDFNLAVRSLAAPAPAPAPGPFSCCPAAALLSLLLLPFFLLSFLLAPPSLLYRCLREPYEEAPAPEAPAPPQYFFLYSSFQDNLVAFFLCRIPPPPPTPRGVFEGNSQDV